MQYALFLIGEKEQHRPLLDAAELHALNATLSNITENDKNESQFVQKLVYGRYKPQPDFHFPRSEVKRHINSAIGFCLAHISNTHVTYLSIDDIKIIDVNLTTSCGHCPTPHKSNDIPFAALISCPSDFELNKRGAAKTVFLRCHNVDIQTDLLNRMGLFALICEDRSYSSPVTKDNWTSRINYRRATKKAQELR
ncbi:hypothetical protein PVK62_13575 [Aliivibrio sp. S3MY1]|uniref:hypothetical protein n=1 Tax=Aliivibrio sp. S3MY1 TaxID=3028424 RepID=UPI0023792843|nr:hypothetical protein [Aliivibrio sp. S3MY1]MDD9196853.1 hypothetical protein [Aliivibrio sp. S3MY1]